MTGHTTWKQTKRARATLDAIRTNPYGVSVPRLAELLETSPQGAARSASALVARGVVLRRVDGDGHVRYWAPR